MASLRTRGDWLHIDFRWKGVRCRESTGKPNTKAGLAEARRMKKQIEGEMAAGTFDYAKWFPDGKKVRLFNPSSPTTRTVPTALRPFAGWWLELKRPFWSNAHYLDRKGITDSKIVPYFGEDKLVSSFTLADVERFIGGLAKDPVLRDQYGKLSPRRINAVRATLREILQRAKRERLLDTNPVLEVKCLRENANKIDPLSLEEVKALLTKGFTDPEMRRFYTVLICTGMRPSELIALKWTVLDWHSKPPAAKIEVAFTKGDGEHATKSRSSERFVDLRPPALAALKEQRAATLLKSEWVFCNQVGGPLNHDNLHARVWTPALKRAGVRYRNPYQCRHTFATLALSAGEEIGWVAKQLGHANTEMVIRHYYKWVRNNTRHDGSAFDRVVEEAGL